MTVRRTIAAMQGAVAGALFGVMAASAGYASAPEDEIKLALTYNIARFVTWPEHAEQVETEFRLCVLGREPQRIAGDKLSRRRLGNRPIAVVALNGTAISEHECELVYVPESSVADSRQLLAQLAAWPVLTVSDEEGFAASGGIVELRRAGDRIAMRINVDAGRRAGLSISSQLLALATVVSDAPEPAE